MQHARFPPMTRAQVRAVDHISIERFGLPGVVLMENAARGLAAVAAEMLPTGGTVAIVCGGGNNGGDGYAAARHLANAGFDVSLLAAKPVDELEGDAGVNARVARAMDLPIEPATPEGVGATKADLLIDALLGTGLTEAPRGEAAALIEAMNAHAAPVLAADVPSGLDCDTGRPLGACVAADATATFVAEKVGFAGAREWTGRVTVVAIGCPRAAIQAALGQAGDWRPMTPEANR